MSLCSKIEASFRVSSLQWIVLRTLFFARVPLNLDKVCKDSGCCRKGELLKEEVDINGVTKV